MILRGKLTERFPVYFFLLYFLTAAFNAVYGTYLPVYLDGLGFTSTAIGSLLAVSPFVRLFAQPIWGVAGDRTKSTNRLYRWVLVGSGVVVLFYPLTISYALMFVIVIVFTFFNTPLFMMQDVIALQAIEPTRFKYGTIRMGATIGFSIWVLVAGWVADRNITYIFPLSALIAGLAFLVSYRLPAVRGHQTPGNHVSPLLLLKNRPLILLVAFCFFLMLGIGYYFIFFSIYYQNLGADNAMIGLSFMIAAVVEIPFLLFAERIIGRLGIKRTLLLAGFVMGVRWLLLGLFTDLTGILVANVLHGFTLIVIFYCMAVFINREVPKELKSSGQSFFGIFGVSIPQMLAGVLGGLANDAFGMQTVFLVIGLFTLVSVVVFAGLFYWLWRREPKIVPTTADLPL